MRPSFSQLEYMPHKARRWEKRIQTKRLKCRPNLVIGDQHRGSFHIKLSSHNASDEQIYMLILVASLKLLQLRRFLLKGEEWKRR